MTVKALITLLENFDGDKKVIFENSDCMVEDFVVNEGIEGEVVIGEF